MSRTTSSQQQSSVPSRTHASARRILRGFHPRVPLILAKLLLLLLLVGGGVWAMGNLMVRMQHSLSSVHQVEDELTAKRELVDGQKKQISRMMSSEGAIAAGRRNGMVMPGEVPVDIEFKPKPKPKAAAVIHPATTSAAATTALPGKTYVLPTLGGIFLLALLALLVRRFTLRPRRRADTLTPRLELRRQPVHAAPAPKG